MDAVPERRPTGDKSELRISDNDRHKAAEVLREAAGEGRIDFEELDQRLEAVYAAKTYGDLVPITADLPSGVTPRSIAPHREVLPSTTTWQGSTAVMGECKRRGAWLVPATHTAFAFMGSIELDLREASFAQHDVTITATAIMGEVKIVVDAFTQVVVDGVPIMGEFSMGKDKVTAQLSADSPVVRVRGMALMGSVNVLRHPPPGTPKKFLGSY